MLPGASIGKHATARERPNRNVFRGVEMKKPTSKAPKKSKKAGMRDLAPLEARTSKVKAGLKRGAARKRG
jgi:hypothetical protein